MRQLALRLLLSVIRLATASLFISGHGEWSELGSRDIDHATRGARARERDAIELIRAAGRRIS
jgi:hypothetical protein